MEEKKVDLGEMINVWIQHHGSLDLNTPEEDIKKFYDGYIIGVDPAMGPDHMVTSKIHPDGTVEILKRK